MKAYGLMDSISISINGGCKLNDGMHRLCAFKLLGYNTIIYGKYVILLYLSL